jgi:hypothetical protein
MNIRTTNRGGRKEASECSNCGWTHKGKKGWGWWALLLHHVRLRGIDRVLCTSCVLRLHPSSFCPLCFVYFDAPSIPNNPTTLPCSKCSSLAHSRCLPTAATKPSASYTCPPCSNPNFSFFDLDEKQDFMDLKLSSVLLCAARIASASMNRAVIVARADADRKVREALLAKKRAHEALEHLAAMVEAREKNSRRKIGNENGNGNSIGNSNVQMKVEVVESMQSNGNERVETKPNIATKIEVRFGF